jgi:hypothetical protein
LKRTQKGREDERTGRGRPAVNGIELRNLGTCRILPKVCSHWKATSVAAPWRAVIACVEDKIVQRAVVMILERIYEMDFYDISYGFRPDRSCHQALSVLGQIIATRKVNWISDADIRGFFDNVCHERMVEFECETPWALSVLWDQ